jgi:hypothetical protein
MDFVIFGFTDNFVLILGMYFSYTSVEFYLDKYLKSFERNASNQLMLACVSAGLGNTFSDALGFLVTGNFTWTALTIVGCLLGMIIIPIMEKIKN